MNQDHSRLELWIHDIQSYLDKVIGGTMEQAGFSFDKLNYSYKRKLGRNLQTFGFLFINQYPTNHRISFVMQIRNSDVRDLKSSFFKHQLHKDPQQPKDSQLTSLNLFLGDFMQNGLSQSSINDYSIINNNDLFEAVEHILDILAEKAIPLCDNLTNVAELDEFYESYPGCSVNSINPDNMMSDLAICKMVGRRNINHLFANMIESVDEKIRNEQMVDMSARTINEFFDFLQGR
ncbi:MAG: hypothetical protein C5B59_17745 [Bacteroidetes bacterium]|nr:MAG: hypothetical protein C5B59_17745 [Bacteroidota bacterium]